MENSAIVQSAAFNSLSKQLREVEDRIELFRDSQQLVKTLLSARDGAAEFEESILGDSFSRTAIRQQVSEAYAEFGIVVAETEPHEGG